MTSHPEASIQMAECFYICAPTAKDAALLAETLAREKIRTRSFPTLEALAEAFGTEVEGIIVAQEALQPRGVDAVYTRLLKQPAWSDVPIVLLTLAGRQSSEAGARLIERLGDIGNVTMLERPARIQTLISTVRSAQRARRRQYQVRELLLQREQDAARLAAARDALEKRVAERTVELNTANANLRELSGRLMQLRDEESRRLARDLHDSVGQLITAIGMNVTIVKAQSHKLDTAGAKAVAENQKLLAEVVKEIRTMSHLLHPPLLDELGLTSALRIYVDGYSARSHIDVDLIIPSELGRLPSDLEISCFRIVQECLTNIHRHSKSARASIKITEEESHLSVEVRDSGKGISSDRLAELRASGGGGVGLAGMRERVRQHGGTLQIVSDTSGTTVTSTLPLQHSSTVDLPPVEAKE